MSHLDFSALREGRPDCPSDFTIDRLVAGELAADRAADTERHASGCADCSTRLEKRRRGWDAVEDVDSRVLLSRIRTKADEAPTAGPLAAWFRRLFTVLVPVAVVGAAALLVVPRPGAVTDADPLAAPSPFRTKGGVSLHVHRLAAAGTEELASGAKLRPGDRLRFSIDLPAPGFVRVFGVGADAVPYEVFPSASDSAERPAGPGQLLPGAVQVDDDPASERLFLVACATREAPARCVYDTARAAVSCPEACQTASFVLEKGRE